MYGFLLRNFSVLEIDPSGSACRKLQCGNTTLLVQERVRFSINTTNVIMGLKKYKGTEAWAALH